MPFLPRRSLLKLRLKEVGMKQIELARKLGMERQQISDYANTRHIMSLEIAKSSAEIIGCSIDDLYDWDEVPPSERKLKQTGE